MSDATAGRASGGPDDTGLFDGEGPPTILLVALGIAGLIAVSFIAFLVGSSAGEAEGGKGTVAPVANVGEVVLSVSVRGAGKGEVQLTPTDKICTRSCEQRFVTGTRLTATADADSGSNFEGWGDACEGVGRCSFVIEEDRSLSVTFEPEGDVLCDDPAAIDGEADCEPGEPRRRPPVSDCDDRRDNDGDGLVDSTQDPGCDENNSEAGGDPPSSDPSDPGDLDLTAPPPPPPPPAARNECVDGRDNDGDGLTDTAQDPGCERGMSESGSSSGSAPLRLPADCNDRRDNDGDGLTDTAQDPGCEDDKTEDG